MFVRRLGGGTAVPQFHQVHQRPVPILVLSISVVDSAWFVTEASAATCRRADVRTCLRDRHPRRSGHASSFSIDLAPGLLSFRIKFFYRSWTGVWIPSYRVHKSISWKSAKPALAAYVPSPGFGSLSEPPPDVAFSSLFRSFVLTAGACSPEVTVTSFSPTPFVSPRCLCNTHQRFYQEAILDRVLDPSYSPQTIRFFVKDPH